MHTHKLHGECIVKKIIKTSTLHPTKRKNGYLTIVKGEPPKVTRGHATSYSARINSIMLNVTKNNTSS